MNKKIKQYLKELGLDTDLYDGYFVTDTRIVAKIDKTIIHITLNFKGHRAYIVRNEVF